MFSLYKNIIAGNIQPGFINPSIDTHTKILLSRDAGKCKLFSLPVLPHIPKPESGGDTLRPPYRYCYIEGSTPGLPFELGSCGALIIFRQKDKFFEEAVQMRRTVLEFGKPKFLSEEMYEEMRKPDWLNGIKSEFSKGAEYFMETRFFWTSPNHNGGVQLLFYSHILITKTLGFLSETILDEKSNIVLLDREEPNEPEEVQELWHIFGRAHDFLLDWLFDFLRFVNLSNIIVDTEPLEAKTTKFIERRHSINKTHYHILKVKKPSLTKRSGKIGHEETPMPLHQVRGHLADYTQGKGLFGKYNIRVWVPEHWRGDLEYGQIRKDYKLVQAGKR